MPRLMLIDGNSLLYRAFYALPTDLATASGQVTNAVYGFTSMLVNLVRDHEPDEILVAFDAKGPNFRHELEPQYKAQRSATPDLLVPQFGLARQVIDVMGITRTEVPGVEADDVLGTLATQRAAAGAEVILVTGDRDAYQLVDDAAGIRVLYNRRGVSDYVLYDEAGILERTGVKPASYVEYAALRGDPSDNLPGVPKVGEKTAAKLINAHGGIDGIYDNLDQQTPKLSESLAEHQERVRLNWDLMTIRRDVELPPDVEGPLNWGPPDDDALADLFELLEFRSLHERLADVLPGLDVAPAEPLTTVSAVVETGDQLDSAELLARLDKWGSGEVAIGGLFAGGDERRGALETLLLTPVPPPELADGATLSAPVLALSTSSLTAEVTQRLTGLLAASGSVHAERAGPLLRTLAMGHEIDVPGVGLDVSIAAYLLESGDSRRSFEELLARHLQMELPGDVVPDGQLAFDAAEPDPVAEAAAQLVGVAALVGPLTAALTDGDLWDLYDDIERPLIRVLARMEAVGVGVDVEVLGALRDELAGEADRLRLALHADAGREFNTNSTKQLREILFEELGLTPLKKTKTGYSTDHSTLERLRDAHPIVANLLDYREVEKLRSTYGEALLAAVQPDGRIHARFQQTVARTGRLSSEDPNLHNIPVRTAIGRRFRDAFVPSPGCRLIVADYDQIELRVIAHLSDDPGLVRAFAEESDVHRTVAARVNGIAEEEVDQEQRSQAKMVSYGLAYGMESFGLGQRLGIETKEAAVILDAYFEAFPAVRAFMDGVIEQTRSRGYTLTEMGRRRPMPEISSGNRQVRQAAERQAMNAPIQGLAADIFKVALVRLDEALTAQHMATRVILQVHDEVVLETPEAETDAAVALTTEILSGAFELSVPLAVSIAVGDSWGSAKQ